LWSGESLSRRCHLFGGAFLLRIFLRAIQRPLQVVFYSPLMPAPNRNRQNRIQRLWQLITTGKKNGRLYEPESGRGESAKPDPEKTGLDGMQDSPDGLGSYNRMKDYMLDLPETAKRPINGSLDLSNALMEMATWSREARDVGSYLARDSFMEQSGRFGSWSIAKVKGDDEAVHPDVIAIGKNLAGRRSGKELILGGTRLKRAASDAAAFYGDAFLEVSIDKEGIGRNDYGIARSLYLPSLSVFVDETSDGQLNGYWQRARMTPSEDDIFIHPIKMLHFSHEKQRRYGQALLQQSIPPWQKLKRVAPDVEKAVRESAIAPWLHIMPETYKAKERAAYKRNHETMQMNGVISNLYLAHGTEVRRAVGGNADLQSIIEHWLNLRAQLVPSGFPSYLFPRLSTGSATSNKELANQPAAVYARMIADIRGMLGDQLRWAIDLEILLVKGYDFLMEHHDYDIAWPTWDIVPNGQNMPQLGLPEDKSSDAPSSGKKEKPKENDDEPKEDESTSHKVRTY
jgi:hypothetical protein